MAIIFISCLAGFLNAQRVQISFFGLPPSSDDEKLLLARKELNKEIPLIKFEDVKIIFEENSKIFIDARNADEFEKGHMEEAINLPQYSLDKFLPEFLQKYNVQTPFVIYCGGLDCSASIQLANQLFEKGYRDIAVYGGGWKEWQKRYLEKK